jgi:hypothetical protein
VAEVSSWRYFRCSKCGAVFDKGVTLSGWGHASSLYGRAALTVSGSRTCACGNVMQVTDIYRGVYDCTASRRILHFLWIKLRRGKTKTSRKPPDNVIVAEIKELLPHAKVAVAHIKYMGGKVSEAGLAEEIEYIADRVRPKYGLTDRHFEQLFKEAWEDFWAKNETIAERAGPHWQSREGGRAPRHSGCQPLGCDRISLRRAAIRRENQTQSLRRGAK